LAVFYEVVGVVVFANGAQGFDDGGFAAVVGSDEDGQAGGQVDDRMGVRHEVFERNAADHGTVTFPKNLPKMQEGYNFSTVNPRRRMPRQDGSIEKEPSAVDCQGRSAAERESKVLDCAGPYRSRTG